MAVHMSSTTSSGTAPVLSIYQRHDAIQYRSEDGTVGATAYPINYEELYNLKGRLLTLIDATFTDPEQRKAQKDVVWHTLRDWMDGIIETGGSDVEELRAEFKASQEPAQN